MDNFLWRSKARIVAYVDTVMSIVGFVTTIVAICFSAFATVSIADIKEKDPDSSIQINVFLVIVWILIAAAAVFVCVDLWAAVMLLKATELGADPVRALRRAFIWRNTGVIFLVFGAVFTGFTQNWVALVLNIAFRGILLYVVCKFIEELRQIPPTGSSSNKPESDFAFHKV